MGIGQLLRRAEPMLQAAMMEGDGESNLDMLRRLATPKFNGLRPRTEQQPLDEGKTPMLLPRDQMMPQNPNAPPIDPGFTAPRSPYGDLYNRDPGFTPRPTASGVPALAATPDGPQLLPRETVKPYVGITGTRAPDVSTINPDDILRTTARLRERTLTPVTTTDSEPIPESGLMRRPTQPLEPVDNGGRSVEGLIYDKHGRPLKPHYLQPASEAALLGRQEYIDALQAYDPQNHNSGLVSSLLGAGRGALAGLRYGPGGAIGGALEGGIHGAVHPALDEEYAKRRDLGEAQHDMAGDLKFRDEQTANLLKRAQIYKDMNPEGQVLDTASGYYRSSGTNASPITAGRGGPQLLPRAQPGAARVDYRENPATGQLEAWEIRQGEPDKRLLNKDMVKTKFGWATTGEALGADATAENRNWTREHIQQQDTQHITERTQDQTQHNDERTQARTAAAAKLYSDIVAANAEAGKYQNLAEGTSATAKDAYGNFLKPYYQSMAESEKQKGVGKANELNTSYPDIYEAGAGEGGWAYAKPKSLPSTSGNLQPRSTSPTQAGRKRSQPKTYTVDTNKYGLP